jgi:hypothetical protein
VALVVVLWLNIAAGQSYRARIAQLESRAAQVDTVYVRDTLTLTKVRRVTDSLIVTDTLTFTDTVTRVIMAERRACDAVIQACEQRVAARDAIIKELKKKPSVLKHLPWVVGGFLLHEAID